MIPRHIIPVLLLLMLPLFAKAGNSREQLCNSGVCFDSRIEVNGEKLSARGIGTFRVWGFRVYTTTLYIPDGVEGLDEVLGADTPRRLVLHYHRSITAEELAESTEEFARKNPRNDMDALRDRFDKLYEAYKEVSSGDEYSITYDPGKGTTVALNGEDIVHIEGEDFARAFFGIWLSEEPISSSIRDRLIELD